MFLAYFDESGDDGLPGSSQLFVPSAVYLHHRHWKEAFQATHEFRRELAAKGFLPFSVEFHTRELLLDKDPFHALQLPPQRRFEVLREFCRHFAKLEVKAINVVINKTIPTKAPLAVLDRAVTYLIQRLENDLKATDDRFLIITDEGRVGKMRATARRIQHVNFVPSKFGTESQRLDIRLLVEDPLPKKSHESYFIQFADMLAYLVQLHCIDTLGLAAWPNRLKSYMTPADVTALLDLLKPRLNLKASGTDPYGIVCYPKK